MLGPLFLPRSPRHHERRCGARSRNTIVRHHLLAGIAIAGLLLVSATAALYAHAQGQILAPERTALVTPGSTSRAALQPADRFMQSIVTDDGALGWRQLCPAVKAQLPQDALVQQAMAQREALTKYAVRLTVKTLGAHSHGDGTASHVYLVTAHWPSGFTQTRTFTVLTEASGCVADVQNA